jgi:hypothetical protein
MKSRDGFAAALVLFVVLALVVAGGIAYVHYIYLPKMAAQGNTPVASSSSTPSVPASPTATTPIATQVTSGGCADNDMNCLIAAAQNCSPTSMEWTQTINLFGFFNQTSQVHLALTGLNSDSKCAFSERTDNLILSLTSSTIQAAQAKGITQAQIQQQLQTSQAQARQQSVGTTINCALSTNTLVQILTKWSGGSFGSSDLASGNCVATTPSGAKTPLYTGGSMPLTPSKITVYLYAGSTNGINGVTFKVNSLTATEVNVTVTDQKTGANQTATLAPNNTMTVAGHVMTVTSIQQVKTGTVNGQPSYDEQATLTYQ